MALEAENEYFDEHRDGWLAQGHEGKWAVVYGTELLGLFPKVEDGFRAGVEKWGAVTFLVKRITPKDRIEKITRARIPAGERLR